ncbi:DUF4345 domain-containing protein [Novosphingobium sp. B 225]|uniref:DUF4345 domain-containing protein n=1 Tax=Novosphingobium sp. B 225 TaxID=1961849 RepID=UPI001595AFF0|nr:DUF4345 domain-containing protein [Novosphingobium sp. B 225]
MGQRLLRWFLVAFGAVCAAIALVHIAFGPASIPGSVPVNAIMDSEDRFYATLFLGFGLAHIWAAQDLSQRSGLVLAMQAVFFAGGLARLISVVAVGWPSGLFIFLGGLELVIPVGVWWGLKGKPFVSDP